MKKIQTGFTLIELAIVLVIIGLLLGGVLKGQELINSAKAKNIAGDFKNAQIFIYGYQDKFRALPGDDAGVVAHIGGKLATGGTVGDARIEGAWDSAANPAVTEAELFWQHVRLAGFATGPTSDTDPNYYPRNADNGRIGVQSLTAAFATITNMTGLYVVCSGNIAGRLAKQIDINLDDGETSTGSLRAVGTGTAGTGTNAITSATIADGSPYTVCMTF